MARLYANENFPFPVVEELRRLRHDAVTVAETGKANRKISDEQVLEFAISEGRAVLTLNHRHFFRLHRQRLDHRGIVACTYDPNFAAEQTNPLDGMCMAAGSIPVLPHPLQGKTAQNRATPCVNPA